MYLIFIALLAKKRKENMKDKLELIKENLKKLIHNPAILLNLYYTEHCVLILLSLGY